MIGEDHGGHARRPNEDVAVSWYAYRPYVSAAQKRANATGEIARRRKKGLTVSPVYVEGLKLAKTFWGKAWCTHIESLAAISNRLSRGKTYVRNGSVIDLQIAPGKIDAVVIGSEIYEVTVTIKPLPPDHWSTIKNQCSGQINSLVELLQGKLSKSVMEVATAKDGGMFPHDSQMRFECSCPDGSPGHVCKHVAAVFYGVGVRLDEQPDLLFTLRGVDHLELITAAAAAPMKTDTPGRRRTIAASSIGAVFGIEMEGAEEPAAVVVAAGKPSKANPKPRSAKKKPARPRVPKSKTRSGDGGV
jgi:uncharacterized Zn finger protein